MSEKYFAFIESNWWEHESWWHFFKLEENFEAMWLLDSIARRINERSNEAIKEAARANQDSIFTMRCRPCVACSKYRVSRKLYTKEEAEKEVERLNEKNSYTTSVIYDKPLKVEKLRDLLKIAGSEDPFYKGTDKLRDYVYKRVPSRLKS